MNRILINVRNISAPLTGVQRYTRELIEHLDGLVQPIGPHFNMRGKLGHSWEQFLLPTKLHGRLLFSPANSGPLAIREQVVTIHDMAIFDVRDGYTDSYSAWHRWLLPRLANRVSHIIVNSRFTRDRLLATTGIDPAKVSVIHLGVTDRFRPEARIGDLDPRYQLPPGKPYLLSLGSLEHRKNLGRLLEAWSIAQRDLDPAMVLALAGERGAGHVFAKAHLNLPPRTILTGRVREADLPRLVSGAEAFLYPSLYEGFGLPPLEAMASGVPVLASDRTAMPEVLGNAALMVDPEHVAGMARGIIRLVQDRELRAVLGRNGIARATRYSWRRCADATYGVLHDMALGLAPSGIRRPPSTIAIRRPITQVIPADRWCLIMATMGRDRHVDEFLASLHGQIHRNLRVVIVDQNADDRLVPIVAKHASTIEIEHLRMPPQGVSAARNHGLSRLRDEAFVAFPDDDCLYEPLTLHLATRIFQRLPDIGALIASHDTPERIGLKRGGRSSAPHRLGLLRRTNTFALFFRSGAVRRIDGFDRTLGPGGGSPWLSGEDSDYLIRVVDAGAKVLRCPQVRTYHPAVDASTAGFQGKAFGYGRGRIRLLRKNGFPAWTLALNVAMPLVGSLIATKRDRGFRWYLFLGRLFEWCNPAKVRS
jgi:glycosyltransferase involved in cell wall biosynthesis